MKLLHLIFFSMVLSSISLPNYSQKMDEWIEHARITTPYGYNVSWEEGVKKAVENGANVILDWANFSDSYKGRILDFNSSLQDFEKRAQYVHSKYPEIKYMVYFAPFELQTYESDLNMDGRDDDGKGSTYTDHPEWLQVGIDGRKAVFYGSMPGMPFWVEKTSEDTWLSPSNREYRKIIFREAKEIARYVDAIWFDVPHLCFNFGDEWQNQWSSVDNESMRDFFNETGYELHPPLKPDWKNKAWLKFVEWRYKQILDYVRNFRNAVKEANPDCKVVIETSSSGGADTTQHASDITRMPYMCDVVAHEYGGPYYECQYYSWLYMMAKLRLWRSFDEIAGKPSWLLSYVKHGDTNLARFHSAIVISSSFNYYTSGSIGMADIVDEKFMHDFFNWLSKYDNYFYNWKSDGDVAVVYSRHTLDYMDRGSWEGYAYSDEFNGILMMLIESNIPFKVIGEDELDMLPSFKLAILPDFACMNESEAEKIREYVKNGGNIFAINDTSLYTEYGMKRKDFLLSDVFGINWSKAEDKFYENKYGEGAAIFTPMPLGRYFIWAAQPWSNFSYEKEAEGIRSDFINEIKKIYDVQYEIDGNAISFSYENGNRKMMRIINFNGIKHGNAIPSAQYLKIKIKGAVKDAKILDYMGEWKNINVEKENGYSIISFPLNIQSTLIYSIEGKNVSVTISKPQRGKFYIMDREIMAAPFSKAIVIGGITIVANAENAEKVDFYIDEVLKYEGVAPPYSWFWNEFSMGSHEIKVVAYNDGIKAEDGMDVIIFNI